uniref:Sulfotransfer_1 domain-containing protein n=1 Tax=Parastrongyloides trichosuri TaxID=131310 RepID=A0A0N5A6Q7_PARTI
MFKRKHLLLFIFLFIILSNQETTAKKQQKKIQSVDEAIDLSIPIPMIKKSFPNKMKLEYMASPKYKLGTCLVGKNFSSMLIRIFCSLNAKYNESKDYIFNYCERAFRYISLEGMAKKNKIKRVTNLFKRYDMFMVVRNPVDRLISGFMQICYYRTHLKKPEGYCYGCGKNLECFIDKLQHELWSVVKENIIPAQFNDFHFYPQTWQCQYYKHKNDYNYIKYPSSKKGKFYNTIAHHLAQSHVPTSQIGFINKKMRITKTKHATVEKNATREYKTALYNNVPLLKKVCTIFYYDYIEFGYDFPKECNITKNSLGITASNITSF